MGSKISSELKKEETPIDTGIYETRINVMILRMMLFENNIRDTQKSYFVDNKINKIRYTDKNDKTIAIADYVSIGRIKNLGNSMKYWEVGDNEEIAKVISLFPKELSVLQNAKIKLSDDMFEVLLVLIFEDMMFDHFEYQHITDTTDNVIGIKNAEFF